MTIVNKPTNRLGHVRLRGTRKDGLESWQARMPSPGGKKIGRTFYTRAEAEAWLAEMRAGR